VIHLSMEYNSVIIKIVVISLMVHKLLLAIVAIVRKLLAHDQYFILLQKQPQMVQALKQVIL
ncbi:MAG: hypothetical protein ACOVOV_07920, partial [Dolichospermum sp.]